MGLVEKAELGIISLITNHAFLSNLTLRGLRQQLLDFAATARVLNLHGNMNQKERGPGGTRDENVFDIQQGVAIGAFARTPRKDNLGVWSGDIWGERASKYGALIDSTLSARCDSKLAPASELYLLVPFDAALSAEYEKGVALTTLMPLNKSAVVSGRDDFAIDESREALRERLEEFCDPQVSDEKIRSHYGIKDAGGYILSKRRRLVLNSDPDSMIEHITYRPFDIRFIAFSRGVLTADQGSVMRQMVGGRNLALIFMRQVALAGGFSHIGITRNMVDNRTFYSNKGILYLAPLYLQPESDQPASRSRAAGKVEVNIDSAIAQEICSSVGMKYIPIGVGDLTSNIGPEGLLHYAYAVFNSREYRTRYLEFLKTDFPHLPLTTNAALFVALARIGCELTGLHTLDSPKLKDSTTAFVGDPSVQVGKVSWASDTVWLDPDHTSGFKGVGNQVWEFRFGGYQVCEKWLKDRRGRTLSPKEIDQYKTIVAALRETISLVSKIDQLIGSNGGWPEAFDGEISAKARPKTLQDYDDAEATE